MDYHGNPHKDKDKASEKNVEKVVTGEVINKPKSIGKKFKDVFFGGDLKSAARFAVADILLPGFRDLLFDMLTRSSEAIIGGSKRVIYGESVYERRRPPEYRSRILYNNIITRDVYPRDPRESRDPRFARERSRLPDRYREERPGINDIILAQKEDAELVVEQLIDIIDKYDYVSLADFYKLLGWASSAIDFKWGWTYLHNVEIRQVRDGWLIDLPPLEAI